MKTAVAADDKPERDWQNRRLCIALWALLMEKVRRLPR